MECHSLVNLAPSYATFQNLTTLEVCFCDGLSNLITTKTAKSLCQLLHFEVRNCDMVTEIIDKQGDETKDDIILTKLQSLKLVSLRSLASFCSGNYTFKFPSLKEVLVEKCPKMKIFSPSVLSTPKLRQVCFNNHEKRWEGNLNTTMQQLYTEMVGFDGLKYLRLSEFPELKEIWHGTLPVKFFSQLKSMAVDDCSFFLNAVPSNLLRCLGDLEKLNVRNCDFLERVFDLEGIHANDTKLLPRLYKLHLSDLPRLQLMWSNNPERILELEGLMELKIHNCSNLRSIFTPSMALGLDHLEKIEIRNCIILEEIITKGKADEGATPKTIFPRLQQIVLKSLPSLININSGECILEFSSLKEITIKNCPNMKSFICSFLGGQLQKIVDEGRQLRLGNLDGRSTPSNDKVEFLSLEKLGVDWHDAMEEIVGHQVQADFFCKLKVLELINFPDDRLSFPSNFLQNFPSLERLIVSNALFEEILHEGTYGEGKHSGALERLRKLKLSKLLKLKHLAKEFSPLYLVFHNLEALEVLDCGILEILVPSSVSFQCLTTLEVSNCHELLHLITSATAKSLVQLKGMSISKCKMIQQIVTNEENNANKEVIFSKLELLELYHLPSLVGFSFWNCDFIFPSLKEVYVGECPRMKFFSQGVASTPALKRLRLTDGEGQWCWEGSLNATLQKLFMEKDQPVAQSIQPSSAQRPNLNHIEAAEGETSKELRLSRNPYGSKDHTPEVEATSIVEEQAVKVSYSEPETTQMVSTYQLSRETLNDETEPPQEEVYAASIQESGTAPGSFTSVVQLAPMSTFLSADERESPQELKWSSPKRRKTVPNKSNIEIDHDLEVFYLDNIEDEGTVSNEQLTTSHMSSVEAKITQTTRTMSSLTHSTFTTIQSELTILDEMSPEEMLAFLLEHQNSVTIESPAPTETILEPTTTDIDEKAIRLAIKTVSDFLSKSVECLREPTVVSNVQSACNLLCGAPVASIVSLQQMSVIRNLSIKLSPLTQRFQQASSIIENDSRARFEFKCTSEDAARKIQEVAKLAKKRSQLQNHTRDIEKEIKNMEVQLAMLRSQVNQANEALADLGPSIRKAGIEARTLQLKAAESKKMCDLLNASVRQANADYEASKTQFETHASLFFKT